ncbi:hypothetical protein [Neisseria subflava]|nr:hypothetical protein [Neisseria subflava]
MHKNTCFTPYHQAVWQQAVACIKPRACLRAHTLPMNHKEFEIYA